LTSNYFESYEIINEKYGTKTKVTVNSKERVMVTNSLPNHKTGEFPGKGNPNTISAQNDRYTFPINPKYTGQPEWVREPGIAINGIKFEPGTAEVVVCDTGENYRVEAFQDIINLGLDFNHAHVQPTGAYHYHGTPTSVINESENKNDLVHIGFAHDGFPMYYSKSNAYKPSYKLIEENRSGEDCSYTNPKNSISIAVNGHPDGTFSTDFEYVEGFGDLDECNGATVNGQYMYFVTEAFPYVSRCLMGEVTQVVQRGHDRNQRNENTRGETPDVSQIFKDLDVNKDGKLSQAEVKGPLKEQFNTADLNKDGFLSKEEIEKSPKPQQRNGPPRG
jgi:hypothetical protein